MPFTRRSRATFMVRFAVAVFRYIPSCSFQNKRGARHDPHGVAPTFGTRFMVWGIKRFGPLFKKMIADVTAIFIYWHEYTSTCKEQKTQHYLEGQRIRNGYPLCAIGAKGETADAPRRNRCFVPDQRPTQELCLTPGSLLATPSRSLSFMNPCFKALCPTLATTSQFLLAFNFLMSHVGTPRINT